MKKFLFFIVLSPFLLFSCNSNKEYKTEPSIVTTNIEDSTPSIKTWEFDTLRFKKNVYLDNDSTKAGMTINLSFEYPTSAPDSVDLLLVQNFFSKMFSNKNNIFSPPRDIFNTVIDEYERNAIEYAKEWQSENKNTDFSDYEQSTTTVGKLTSGNIMTIITQQISFLGAANGTFYIKYDNIDLRQSSIIKEANLFNTKYKDELAALIQREIGKRNRSANKDEHIDLLVDMKEIKPNGNFFISKNGLVYTYNQNEIAPYTQGPVQVTLPYKDIEPIVNSEYKYLIKELINPN